MSYSMDPAKNSVFFFFIFNIFQIEFPSFYQIKWISLNAKNLFDIFNKSVFFILIISILFRDRERLNSGNQVSYPTSK